MSDLYPLVGQILKDQAALDFKKENDKLKDENDELKEEIDKLKEEVRLLSFQVSLHRSQEEVRLMSLQVLHHMPHFLLRNHEAFEEVVEEQLESNQNSR